MSDTLLLIENEAPLAAELARRFRCRGWEIVHADTLAAARRLLLERRLGPLVVVSDLVLPDGDALKLFEEVRGRDGVGEWIFLTGQGSVPDSANALRLGAYDFLEKSGDPERLDLVVASAARGARAQRRLRDQTDGRTRRYAPASFVGRSAAAQRVRELLDRLSRAPFSTLTLGGETGTGKGLAARILHHNGPRAAGPLVEVNCAALPRELLESELFGHEAGAFTGAKGRRRGLVEQAHGGTLFLDEIGEMEPGLQVKLLKVIEDQTVRRLGDVREIRVDVQIVAATNRDLDAAVKEGAFRSDLFHRLNTFRLELPALRTRIEDLDDLVPALLAEFNSKTGKQVTKVPAAVWQRLRGYAWPGNVRELRNVIERCVLLAEGDVLPGEWLLLGDTDQPAAPPAKAPSDGGWLRLPLDGRMTLDEMNRLIVKKALERHQYNVLATARTLGTTRETLRYRMQKYRLKMPR